MDARLQAQPAPVVPISEMSWLQWFSTTNPIIIHIESSFVKDHFNLIGLKVSLQALN